MNDTAISEPASVSTTAVASAAPAHDVEVSIIAAPALHPAMERAGVPLQLPDGGADPSLVAGGIEDLDTFLEALAGPRNFARETDPPVV